MDLRTSTPRSANDTLLGLVSLKRTIDKAKAFNEGHLGEYHFDCPHDRPLFAFLGTDAETFAAKVKELESDDAIADWIRSAYLEHKTPQQIEAFNADRRRWHPDPGTESAAYFDDLRAQVAPGRSDVVTWFDLLDLDEGRPVAHAATL